MNNLVSKILKLTIFFTLIIFSTSQAKEKNIDLLKMNLSCGPSKDKKAPWKDHFFALVTNNSFQATRYWKQTGKDKKYRPGDIGYEIFNGFLKKDRFIIKVDGKYAIHSDKWQYSFKIKSDLNIKQILSKGIKATRGKNEWARKCELKSYDMVNVNTANSYLKITKDLNREIKQLETRLSIYETQSKSSSTSQSNDDLIKKLNKALNENKKLKSEIKKINTKKNIKVVETTENKQKEKKEKEKQEVIKKQKISYQSDFELAQSFISDLKGFIKNNPNEFDIIKTTELFIENQNLLDGKWDDQTKKNYKKLFKFTESSEKFSKYHEEKNDKRYRNYLAKLKNEQNKLKENISLLKNYLVENLGSKQSKKVLNEIKNSEKILNGNVLKKISDKNLKLSELINQLNNPEEDKANKSKTEKINKEKLSKKSSDLLQKEKPKKETGKLKELKNDTLKNLKSKLKTADKIKDKVDSGKIKGDLNKLSSLLGSKKDKSLKQDKLSTKKEKKIDNKKSKKKDKTKNDNSISTQTSGYQTIKLNDYLEFYTKDFFDENIVNNYLMIESCTGAGGSATDLSRGEGCGRGGFTNKIMNMVLKKPYNLEYYAFSRTNTGDVLVSDAKAIFDYGKNWTVYQDPRWKISHDQRVCQYEYKYKTSTELLVAGKDPNQPPAGELKDADCINGVSVLTLDVSFVKADNINKFDIGRKGQIKPIELKLGVDNFLNKLASSDLNYRKKLSFVLIKNTKANKETISKNMYLGREADKVLIDTVAYMYPVLREKDKVFDEYPLKNKSFKEDFKRTYISFRANPWGAIILTSNLNEPYQKSASILNSKFYTPYKLDKNEISTKEKLKSIIYDVIKDGNRGMLLPDKRELAIQWKNISDASLNLETCLLEEVDHESLLDCSIEHFGNLEKDIDINTRKSVIYETSLIYYTILILKEDINNPDIVKKYHQNLRVNLKKFKECSEAMISELEYNSDYNLKENLNKGCISKLINSKEFSSNLSKRLSN